MITDITKKEKMWPIWLYCAVVAFALLALCSKSSFLYPFNDWVDANCYFTVGKSMMNGKVLYRDIYDHKGPLLYSIHAFAYLISHRTFIGMYLFEGLFVTAFLVSVYKILRLYLGREISLAALPVLGALLLSAYSFSHGDSAEEMCLPLLSWSLYYSLRYYKDEYPKKMSYRLFLLNGILAGCVLWIKFTMLGFHLAWMLMVIGTFSLKKEWKYVITRSLTFLAGMFVASIPFIIYFGLNHALWDWIGGYIYNNVFVYTTDSQMNLFVTLKSVVRNTLITFIENPQYSVFTVLGVLWITFSHCFKTVEKINIWMLCVATATGVYWGSQAYYHYYGFILSVFVVLGFIPFLIFVEQKSLLSARKSSLWIGLSVAASVLFCYFVTPNRYLRDMKQEDMVQFKFRNIIEQVEEPTLLNYGFLDGGFYTVCDIVPSCKYFAKFNIPLPEIEQSQQDLIRNGIVDFVVTRNFELDESYTGYELVAEDRFFFEDQDYQYYLYKRQ